MGSYKSFLRRAGAIRFMRRKPNSSNLFYIFLFGMVYLTFQFIWWCMVGVGWMIYGTCWLCYFMVKACIKGVLYIKNKNQQK